MSERPTAEKDGCDGCQKRPCVCETVVLPTVEKDALMRRIADCLEQHLPEYGFDPYRYPSGENKSVDLMMGGDLLLSDAHGVAWRLTLTRVLPPGSAAP